MEDSPDPSSYFYTFSNTKQTIITRTWHRRDTTLLKEHNQNIQLHFAGQAIDLLKQSSGLQRPGKEGKGEENLLVYSYAVSVIENVSYIRDQKKKTSVRRVYMVARVNAPRPRGRAVVLCARCHSWAFTTKEE